MRQRFLVLEVDGSGNTQRHVSFLGAVGRTVDMKALVNLSLVKGFGPNGGLENREIQECINNIFLQNTWASKDLILLKTDNGAYNLPANGRTHRKSETACPMNLSTCLLGRIFNLILSPKEKRGRKRGIRIFLEKKGGIIRFLKEDSYGASSKHPPGAGVSLSPHRVAFCRVP